MTKNIYNTLALLALLMPVLLQAQQNNVHPCGTPPGKSDWLKRYQQNPTQYRTGADTTLYMPLTIHVLGNNNGAGYASPMKILDGICQLNDDYAVSDANILYYIEGDFNYIDSTAWNNHNSILVGYQMMMANNIPNTINNYLVSNPAGNAGYNLPSAKALAIGKSYLSLGRHVWSHEIGHNLSIQHPFLGWEGKTYSYSTPTPTTVVYDYTSFKSIFYNSADTTILDTALVELVNGSNCTLAADGFCDTPPDYLSSGGWACDANGLSVTQLKDPNNVDFKADGTNFMTYADDNCGSRFTPQQVAAMRANILSTKSNYLYNQNPTRDTITATVTQNYPTQGEIVNYLGVDFSWSSAVGATKYVFQLSITPTFTVIVNEVVTSDTTITIGPLTNNRTYYWRVKPFNPGYACAPKSQSFQFATSDLSPVQNIKSIQQYRIYPNLIHDGQSVNIDIVMAKSLDVDVMLFNVSGQLVQQERVSFQQGFNHHPFSTNTLPTGMYVLVIRTEDGIVRDKIVVQ
jgi:hypothetical protein